MTGRTRLVVAGGLLVAAAALALPAAVSAGPDSTATVQFGNIDVGSDFEFPPLHDQSPNAKFNLVPYKAVITGGPLASVTYQIGGSPAHPHQVAVYGPGKTPDDIVPASTCPPGPPCVDDPNGRLALSALVASGTFTAEGIFTTPGRYLVLCNVRPHFENFGMYGWVVVK
jgi:hypothetical protein